MPYLAAPLICIRGGETLADSQERLRNLGRGKNENIAEFARQTQETVIEPIPPKELNEYSKYEMFRASLKNAFIKRLNNTYLTSEISKRNATSLDSAVMVAHKILGMERTLKRTSKMGVKNSIDRKLSLSWRALLADLSMSPSRRSQKIVGKTKTSTPSPGLTLIMIGRERQFHQTL